jgi:putative sterol carrier protein
MRGWRRPVLLRQIFRRMDKQLDRAKSRDADAVLHWEIGGRPDGEVDRWQVVIRDGHARAGRKLDEEPTVKLMLDGDQFLRLVTGLATAPELFLSGKLRVEGDLMMAAGLAGLFRIPQAASG